MPESPRDRVDAVVSNAALHHLGDTRAALVRLGQLVRPGRVLAVVGFARTQWRDWPWAVAAFVTRGIAIRVRGKWEHTAPVVWPPPDTSRQLRQVTREVLPGSRIRRLLLGRYLLIWQPQFCIADSAQPGGHAEHPNRRSSAEALSDRQRCT